MVEDLSSLKLSSDTTLLLQEIWVIRQRQGRQSLLRKVRRWIVMQEGDEIFTRAGRKPRPMLKRALNKKQGDEGLGKKKYI
jgi:hypothetical protein